MRLYASAKSANGITYVPDVLIINEFDKEYEYDINGTVEYDKGNLDCVVRGDLEIRDQETDEFRELTLEEKKELIILLSSLVRHKKITINVHPMLDDEKEETINAVNNDILGPGSGTLEINIGLYEIIEIDFEFTPVFVEF